MQRDSGIIDEQRDASVAAADVSAKALTLASSATSIT